MILSIIYFFIIVAVIGFGTWAITNYIPMSPGIAKIIKICAVIICILIAIWWFFGEIPEPTPFHRVH